MKRVGDTRRRNERRLSTYETSPAQEMDLQDGRYIHGRKKHKFAL